MNKEQLIAAITDYVVNYQLTPASNKGKDLQDFLNPIIDSYVPADNKSYPIDEFNSTPEQWQEYLYKNANK